MARVQLRSGETIVNTDSQSQHSRGEQLARSQARKRRKRTREKASTAKQRKKGKKKEVGRRVGLHGYSRRCAPQTCCAARRSPSFVTRSNERPARASATSPLRIAPPPSTALPPPRDSNTKHKPTRVLNTHTHLRVAVAVANHQLSARLSIGHGLDRLLHSYGKHAHATHTHTVSARRRLADQAI